VSSRIEVVHQSVQETEGTNELSLGDHLDSIREGRTRIRNLASTLLGICGMLLSASFIILFFLLKERPSGLPPLVLALLFITIGLLLAALLFAISSVCVRTPMPAATKGERLKNQLAIYQSEYRYSRISVFLLVTSVLCFAASLGAFASWTLLPSRGKKAAQISGSPNPPIERTDTALPRSSRRSSA
jgi:hypothetical protein